MTGDQGAVLSCVQRNMNAFVPPCPRLLLQMTGDQGAVLLCVQRNMNAFVPPPAPAQDYVEGALLQTTGDQGAVLLCVQRNMNAFVPPPPLPKTIASDDRRSRCSAFVCVCAEEHERFCPPPPAHPRPCPRLCSGCTWADDRR